MPRTWSNRRIEHIDLQAPKKGLPAAGWAILSFGLLMMTVYIVLTVNVCLHPVQGPPNQSAPSSGPTAPVQ